MYRQIVVGLMNVCILIGFTGIIQCSKSEDVTEKRLLATREPLVQDMYTADPSAHVFENRLYIYPSHDVENNIPDSNQGDQFDMRDYHVYSISDFDSPIVDHGEVLNKKDIPWAHRQLWAPDAAFKNGIYYLYFPAKDKKGIFRIGVATAKKPYGPFKALPGPIRGSYSIDPAVFIDDDGLAYMYFGGIWGGQLQCWSSGHYNPDPEEPVMSEPALKPRIARMSDDMLAFAEPVKQVLIVDEKKKPITAGDKGRRFFEAPWMHKYKGIYYLSYSTGDTHYIVYATGTSPYGPFTYKGVILTPVTGWTTHHSIVKYMGKWYLFYHDSTLSRGITHLRNIKYAELKYNGDGSIKIITP